MAVGSIGAIGTTSIGALSKTSSDFNMFLKLLTTQMQNQDPLKPMDSTEYTQQLAQYTQVEQTVQQTSTLKDMLAQLSTQNLAQASGFIGREATFDSAVAGLSGDGAARWGYAADRSVSSLTATITDASGRTVATQAIDPGEKTGRFTWDGALATGGKAADGAYTVTFAGVDAEGVKVPVTVTSVGTVREVVNSSGATTLGVNGVQMPMTSLLKLTAAG